MLSAGSFTIPADHPALPGHFPGHPIVPGVVLLDHALSLLAGHSHAGRVNALSRAKFLAPVLPGEKITVFFRRDEGRGLTFICARDGEAILTAALAAGLGEGGF